MTGGGGEAPPANGGEFLLQLLNNSSRQPPQLLPHDPAVAAIGPSVPMPFPHSLQPNGFPSPWSQNHYHQSPPRPPFAPHEFFLQNPNNSGGFLNDGRKLGLPQANRRASVANQQEQKGLVFGSFRVNDEPMGGNSSENRSVSRQAHVSTQYSRRLNGVEVGFEPNSVDFDRDKRGNMSDSRVYVHEGRNYGGGDRNWDRRGGKEVYHRGTVGLPGVVVKQNSGYTNRRTFEQNGERESSNFGKSKYQSGNGEREGQSFSKIEPNKNSRWEERKVNNNYSVSASFAPAVRDQNGENSEMFGNGIRETTVRRDDHKGESDLDDLEERLADTLGLVDEVNEKSEKTKHHRSRDKEYRSDKRGQSIMGQRMRYMKRQLVCRGDIERWNIPFLAIYESLIPAEDEKAKQKQLLALLENVVTKEWPGARLYLYGSCANSFGFPKSDLDVCLSIEDAEIDKSEVLLRLADLLQSENLLNVQALTRARVPIVKLMDPTTGISCDICVNNVLAVVNTKLLRDYAEIDVRLRQLAFMVKHWAKSRGVNETYQGTLSSYAYVLMCIHFLQLRRPAILPCLQEMNPTYSVTVDNVECAYFDHVEKLAGFGSRNGESISRLLWAFFHYWAYCHDYANDVISVRRGCVLSKRFKDWTRRIGNDRHLICIEDPFELSHDLGRVVDRYSIKVLREEFERAAEIMQHDPNPCVTLFEPYVPT